MNKFLSLAAATMLVAFAHVGCASDSDEDANANDDGKSQENAAQDPQTITGRIDTDRAGVGTRALTPTANGARGEIHVVAHRLGKQGSVDVRGDVDAPVAADGSFDLKLTRGARYVFEVARGAESVAYFGWKTKSAARTTVLGISAATAGKAAVALGKVKIVGNGAVAEHCLCDSFDETDTTGIDLDATWFVSARGALITGEQALEEAAEALEEAAEALEEASEALDEAADALEAAKAAMKK